MEIQNDTAVEPSSPSTTPDGEPDAAGHLGGTAQITMPRIVRPAGYHPGPRLPMDVLFMARGRSVRAAVAFGSRRLRAWFSAGDMLLAPAGAVADIEAHDTFEAIGVAFAAARVGRSIGADTLDLALLAGIRLRDSSIATTVEQLLAGSRDTRSTNHDVRRCRRGCAHRRPPAPCRHAPPDPAARGALGSTRLAKVLTLMRERLDEHLNLDTLAASVGLTP